MLLEYIDCPWFIDFLLQEVAQLSANREKCASAICFGTFEADHFCIQCMCVHSFLCVSASMFFHGEGTVRLIQWSDKGEETKSGKEAARQRGGFGLPGTHRSSRQRSVSGGPLIQSEEASAREAPG